MLELFSPAKINLFLRVVNKRADGFHNLSSLFQAIDLGDSLTFEPHDEDVFTCSDSTLPTDDSNLVIKAVQLFRRKTNTFMPLKIHLKKCIPAEAGLGGGSGNAATTLWALNQLMGVTVSTEKLMEWSGEIGSDIPFFFSQGTAFCTGRGEKVQNLPSLEATSLVIVKPNGGMPTPLVFKTLGLNSADEPRSNNDLTHFFNTNNYFNDLEKPAFKLNPELSHLKQQLLSMGFDTVLMSGSGSSFFCLGSGVVPIDLNLRVYSAKFINRKLNNWY